MRNFCFGLLGIGVFLLPLQSVFSAALYIDPSSSTIFRGDAIELSVRLDTDEAVRECVNAVDAIITYPESIVPVDVSVGDSILSMWVERPTINAEARTITFAGGIPNGYCGRVIGDPRLTNTLATIIFRSPGFMIGGGGAAGAVADIAFAPETSAYLNDGLGTKAELALYGASITLDSNAGTGIVDPWREAVSEDTIPPEQFSITLEKDTKAFSGKYYIVFNTTDKQTGIDQYQVMEEALADFSAFAWGRADAPWIEARSPYVLDDQSLNSVIRVKAIDKAGNEYVATLIPDESMRTLTEWQMINYALVAGLLLIGMMVVFLLYQIVKRRRVVLPDDVTVTDHDNE